MERIVTLCTDFGLVDGYVAAIKGVILSMAPGTRLVDISHQVPRQSVEAAAYVLLTAYRYFPQGTIHLIVVDPGVGTARRALAVRAQGYMFVAPDNGVLSYVLDQGQAQEAIALTRSGYWRSEVSATFQGRDLFAPVAAHLAKGVPLGELGEPVDDLVRLPSWGARREADGSVVGRVVYVDIFGNLITDIPADWLPVVRQPPGGWMVRVGELCLSGLACTYASVGRGQALALIGSHGCLEVAVRKGSAAEASGVGIGARVTVTKESPGGS